MNPFFSKAKNNHHEKVEALLQHKCQPLERIDPLINAIGDARIVLLGEASHGTHEYK